MAWSLYRVRNVPKITKGQQGWTKGSSGERGRRGSAAEGQRDMLSEELGL